jgi:hypothetical protein
VKRELNDPRDVQPTERLCVVAIDEVAGSPQVHEVRDLLRRHADDGIRTFAMMVAVDLDDLFASIMRRRGPVCSPSGTRCTRFRSSSSRASRPVVPSGLTTSAALDDWEVWMSAEDAHYERDPTRERSDVVVDGTA